MPNSGSIGHISYWNNLVNSEENSDEGETFEELDPSGRYGRVSLYTHQHWTYRVIVLMHVLYIHLHGLGFCMH